MYVCICISALVLPALTNAMNLFRHADMLTNFSLRTFKFSPHIK